MQLRILDVVCVCGLWREVRDSDSLKSGPSVALVRN